MRVVKIILYVLAFAFFFVIGYVAYVKLALPDVALIKKVDIPTDSASISNGRYLANSVAVCMDCHSQRDWTKFSGPIVSGTLGQGGERFDQKFGFPGKFFSRNITPANISGWKDAEIMRAITSGVDNQNKALFPLMPYLNYGHCDQKDIEDIIAYIKTLKPIKHEVENSVPDFPMTILLNTIPKPASFTKRPPESDKVAYGKYLFTLASCNNCHTKQEKGNPVEGMELAGGFEFKLPYGGTVISANITPDKETGIGNWTEETFVKQFKQFSTDSSFVPNIVKPGEFNTVMPWMMYGNMKDSDIKAIYAYLRTVKPIQNKVEFFKP